MTRETAVKASNLLDAIERTEAYVDALNDTLAEYDISLDFSKELINMVDIEIARLKDELEALQ